jgi:hypothetical protein
MWKLKMLYGLDFTEAYRRVNRKFGKRRLKEIQEETLYAVDTKYRRMKKYNENFRYSRNNTAGLLLALFKIQHWPGAGIMLSLGALITGICFFTFIVEGPLERNSQQEPPLPVHLRFHCRIFLYTGDCI